MTSDLTKPAHQRYNYRNAITGLLNLLRDEGLNGLRRGIGANTVSLCITNNALYGTKPYKTRAILMNVCYLCVTLQFFLSVLLGISSRLVSSPTYLQVPC
jgi:hypothetical protein